MQAGFGNSLMHSFLRASNDRSVRGLNSSRCDGNVSIAFLREQARAQIVARQAQLRSAEAIGSARRSPKGSCLLSRTRAPRISGRTGLSHKRAPLRAGACGHRAFTGHVQVDAESKRRIQSLVDRVAARVERPSHRWAPPTQIPLPAVTAKSEARHRRLVLY
jgi:hypothetical protein